MRTLFLMGGAGVWSAAEAGGRHSEVTELPSGKRPTRERPCGHRAALGGT